MQMNNALRTQKNAMPNPVVLIGLCGVVMILAVALIGLCAVARILAVALDCVVWLGYWLLF